MTSYIFIGLPETEQISYTMKVSGFTPNMDFFMFNVSKQTGISISDIKSESRKESIYFTRAIFSYKVFCTGKYTLSEIGKFMGKTHATIINQIKTIQNRKYNLKLLNFIKEHNINI